MSLTVCRGLQTCLEPLLVEQRVLGLKLAPQIPHFPQSIGGGGNPRCGSDSESDTEEREKNYDQKNPNGEFGGWGFIEALTKEANEEKQRVYVHPLVKRSSSTLSEKSLELCTENLGCETGTDISENSDFSSSSSSDSESGKSPKRERSKLREISEHGKVNLRSFPPPLTSINSSNNIYFKPHREGGRLVIKAVSTAPSQTCLQAERGDGCLKLRFVKDINSPRFEDEEEEDEIVVTEEEEDDDEEEEEEESDDNIGEDIDGNNGNGGGEMGIGNFQRPSRCKEGGHRNKERLIWKPFWVAT